MANNPIFCWYLIEFDTGEKERVMAYSEAAAKIKAQYKQMKKMNRFDHIIKITNQGKPI